MRQTAGERRELGDRRRGEGSRPILDFNVGIRQQSTHSPIRPDVTLGGRTCGAASRRGVAITRADDLELLCRHPHVRCSAKIHRNARFRFPPPPRISSTLPMEVLRVASSRRLFVFRGFCLLLEAAVIKLARAEQQLDCLAPPAHFVALFVRLCFDPSTEVFTTLDISLDIITLCPLRQRGLMDGSALWRSAGPTLGSRLESLAFWWIDIKHVTQVHGWELFLPGVPGSWVRVGHALSPTK